jgi:hypothetical protein
MGLRGTKYVLGAGVTGCWGFKVNASVSLVSLVSLGFYGCEVTGALI